MSRDLLETNLLYNFISPVTGRVLCDYSYVLVGDEEGRATPSPVLMDLFADFIDLKKVVNQIISGTIIIPIDTLPDLPYRRIWLGNPENRPEITGLEYQNLFTGDMAGDIVPIIILPIENMANLAVNHLWIGQNDGSNDRPVAMRSLVDDDNLPPLAPAFIWIGNYPPNPIPPLYGRPIQKAFTEVLIEALAVIATQMALGIPAPVPGLDSVGDLPGKLTLQLVENVIIDESVQAGNLKMGITSITSIAANSNILITPNGTGLVDMTTRRVINVTDPINPLDVVNLQTLQTYIGGSGTVTSVTGTANQITVVNPTTTPVISMPTDVIVTNSVRGGNIRIGNTNSIESMNTNGNINVLPNGTGFVGVGTSLPAYLLDVNGTTRTKRLLGNGGVPTIVLGGAGVIGTGATSSIVGSEVAGRFTLNTGTGLLLVAGIAATFTLTSAMPSGTFAISFTPASTNAVGKSIFVTSISSTQFTLNITGLSLLAISATYVWNYTIEGY